MGIRNKIIWLGKAVAAGILAVGILSVINLGYSFSGIHYHNPTNATDYVWGAGQLKSTMTEGFSWIFMDEGGFNNEEELKKGEIDILLMGSSHMEAINVAANANTGYLLGRFLPEFKTYNIGMSGHTIYRCVDNINNAYSTYAPKRYIIIETDSIKLDINEMDQVTGGTAEEIPSYDSGILFQLQKIPAVKWIYKQVQDWAAQENSAGKERERTVFTEEDKPGEEYKESLAKFLGGAREAVEGTGCRLVIFYHPTVKLDDKGNILNETDSGYLEAFESACSGNGIIFADMTGSFANLYEKEHRLAKGFANTGVGIGHLNRYGHRETARYLSEIIREDIKEGRER